MVETTRLRSIDDELVQEIRRRIVEAFEPEGLWLFGSAARQEARVGSDLDLLVVMKTAKGESKRDRARAIRRLFRGWRVPMDIVVVGPEEFAVGQEKPGHVARIATREGVRLHG